MGWVGWGWGADPCRAAVLVPCQLDPSWRRSSLIGCMPRSQPAALPPLPMPEMASRVGADLGVKISASPLVLVDARPTCGRSRSHARTRRSRRGRSRCGGPAVLSLPSPPCRSPSSSPCSHAQRKEQENDARDRLKKGLLFPVGAGPCSAMLCFSASRIARGSERNYRLATVDRVRLWPLSCLLAVHSGEALAACTSLHTSQLPPPLQLQW